FPLTLEAARAARDKGLHIVLGAPNALRGTSTSPSNLLVKDALAENLCDVLCSDYLPHSMLQAPFVLAREQWMLLDATVDLVSTLPARALGFEPPQIQVGAPLNAILVDWADTQAVVVALWRDGRVVYGRHAQSQSPTDSGDAEATV